MRLRFRQIIKIGAGGIILGGLLYLIFFSPYFVIKSYRLSGVKTVDPEALREKVDRILSERWLGIPQRNIVLLFLRKHALVRYLEDSFPEIKAASLEPILGRAFFHSFYLSIQERKREGIWCGLSKEGSCFYFDKEGYLFQPSPQSKGPFILNVRDEAGLDLRLGDKINDAKLVDALVAVQKEFFQLPDISLDRVEIINANHDLAAVTNQKRKIYFDPHEDMAHQFIVLETLIKNGALNAPQKIRYIDLRINNRAYVK